MADRRPQHPNARLTPKQRLKMVSKVKDDKWSIETAAERFQVDAKTVRKWVDESPRVWWRLRSLRGWSNAKTWEIPDRAA